jgi:hypothetical protein
MRGTVEDWANLWIKGGMDGPRPSTAPPPPVEEFEVPCEREDCRGAAGISRCDTWHQKCKVCDRVQMRPCDEWSSDTAPQHRVVRRSNG